MKRKAFCLIAIIPAILACGRVNSPQSILTRYINSINKHSYAEANALWQNSFGCKDSLIDWHFAWPNEKPTFPAQIKKADIKVVSADHSQARLEIISGNDVNGQNNLRYYALKTADGWKLVNPPENICAAWDSIVINEIVIKYKGNRPDDKFYQALYSMYGLTKNMLGATDKARVHIYMAGSDKEAAELANQQKPIASWSAPSCGVVIFNRLAIGDAADSSIATAQVAARELIGVSAYDAFGHSIENCPLFKNGLATYFWGIEEIRADSIRAKAAAMFDVIPPLDSLMSFRYFAIDEKNNAIFAASFIDYIITSYGWDKLKELARASISTDSLREALRKTDEPMVIENKWKIFIGSWKVSKTSNENKRFHETI